MKCILEHENKNVILNSVNSQKMEKKAYITISFIKAEMARKLKKSISFNQFNTAKMARK